MANQIQIRSDLTVNWAAADPILAQAELTFDVTEQRWKVGDGLLHWTELPYVGIPGTTGIQGVTGITMFGGPSGATGVEGPAGATGIQGSQGISGLQGATGVEGLANFTEGASFPTGMVVPSLLYNTVDEALYVSVDTDAPDKWIQISAGSEQGPQGATGPAGAPQGVTGIVGPAGIQGVTGIQGPDGGAGLTGIQGHTGLGLANFSDTTSYPSMLVKPELLWNRRDEALFVGVTGVGEHWIQISAGAMRGADGLQGATGAYGGPQGATGVSGADGVDGDNGSDGAIGATGLQGPQGVTGISGAGDIKFVVVEGVFQRGNQTRYISELTGKTILGWSMLVHWDYAGYHNHTPPQHSTPMVGGVGTYYSVEWAYNTDPPMFYSASEASSTGTPTSAEYLQGQPYTILVTYKD